MELSAERPDGSKVFANELLHGAPVVKELLSTELRQLVIDKAAARMAFDWNKQFSLAIDGNRARTRYEQTRACDGVEPDHCSMCGRDFCAIRTSKRIHDAQAQAH